MVEYIDQQISDLSWQITTKSADITAADHYGHNLISGSKTNISVWQFVEERTSYDQLPLVEVASERISSRACRVHLIGNLAFTALCEGTVYLHELVERDNRKGLKSISKTSNLHSTYKCNDMLFCAQTNLVITCGNDGAISSFNIDNPKKVDSRVMIKSSLKCMDIITPNEIICGTLDGSLKHFDLRLSECVGTFANQSLSSLVCLKKNPNVNHLAVGGNDQGSIIMYDLRNRNTAIAQVLAHSAAITAVKYRPKDPSILYSSSCDGELFRWNLNTEFTANRVPRKVESISCTSEPLSISSFDINHLGDMVYTTDHGAIFYHKLCESA